MIFMTYISSLVQYKVLEIGFGAIWSPLSQVDLAELELVES